LRGEAMRSEMAEQPSVLERIALRLSEMQDQIRTAMPERLVGSAFLARGSSDSAALLGRYATEVMSGRPSSLVAPSVHTRYRADVDYSGYLVVALSQSGATPEIVATARQLRRDGAVVVGVVNDPDSSLADEVDLAVAIGAGPELAVPATKTVTAQMAVVLAIAWAAGQARHDPGAFSQLPAAVATLLEDEERVVELAQRWCSNDRMVVAARGFCFAAALETALKCKEASLVFAEGFSTADFLHGPIASLSAGFPVLVIDGGGATSADARDLVERAESQGASVATSAASDDSPLRLPDCLPEFLQPIAATVRGQQLAFHLAMARGLDPDRPEGLSKVTLTH
jgi:glutamine---fructose-6-phosphate transaminase (isomerizing)